ncbi:MAG: hypothetical protein AAGF97_06845 [Planctomycetota bacterium]
MASRHREYGLFYTACLSVVLLGGCHARSDGNFETHPSSGTVSVNGKPEAGVVLQLIPQAGNPLETTRLRPGGVSRSDGTFALTTYSNGDGAPVGEYRLVLFWPPTGPGTLDEHPARRPADDDQGPPDRFGGKYFAAEDSPWTLTIEPGTNELGTIETQLD